MTRNSQAGSLDEIRRLLHALPGPDEGAAARAAAHAQAIGGTAGPPAWPEPLRRGEGSLGLFAGLGEWMAAWRGAYPPRLDRPRVAVYAGGHGVARSVGFVEPADTARRIAAIRVGAAAVNSLCRTHDVELHVHEMALDEPTPDIRLAPALDEAGCAAAMAYGMTAVDDGLDAIGLAVIESEATISAVAIASTLFGGDAADWTDSSEAARAADAIASQKGNPDDPFETMRRLGGHDLAALTGALIAARMGRVPVVLDGFAACAAAAVLHRADPALLDHCIVADLVPGPGHRRLLDHLGKAPLLDLGIAGGEGCAAAVALGLLRSVVAVYGAATA